MTQPDFVRRVRWSYDVSAEQYAAWIRGELAIKPLDRAVLGGFAEYVQAAGGPVADVGCGSGRVAAYLHGLGLSVRGVDVSPGMVAAARSAYPDVRFDVGSMLNLDFDAGVFGGVVAWYSIIHIPDAYLPAVFAEFRRVVAPGGYVQLAFQVGNEIRHRTAAGGCAVSLDFYRRRPDDVVDFLRRAGLIVRAQLVREPDEDGDFPEDTPQGFVLARRPVEAGC